MTTQPSAPTGPSTASGLRVYPGPVLPDNLSELVAVAQNLGANILEIPEGEHVTLEMAGPATLILVVAFDLDSEATTHP